MRPRTSLILAVIAVIVLGAGWYFGPHQTPAERERAGVGTLLFPELGQSLERAGKIEITHAGKRFAILRKGDVWTLPSLGFYPVEATKVHAMLAALAELRLSARRTADPAEFATLGVDDPGKPAATGTLVTVSDEAGHPLASLIVGRQNSATAGGQAETLYVRRPGQNRSWLAEGNLSVDPEPDLWIDHSITDIDHKKVLRVAVTHGEETLVFAPRDGKLALIDPAQHPPLKSYQLDSIWRALEDLSFSSVRAGPEPPGKIFAHTVYTLGGGTTVSATLAHEGKHLWVRFAAAGTDAEAKRLAQTFSDWSYRLGAWRESALAPTLADLLVSQPAAKGPQSQ